MEELIQGIIRQAVHDYIKAKTYLLHLPPTKSKDKRLQAKKIEYYTMRISEVKRFFASEWYEAMCDIPAEVILAKCDEVIESGGHIDEEYD